MIRWLLIALLWPITLAAQDMWQVERDLAAIGYDPGVVDGVADARTKLAIQMFQFGNGVYASGVLASKELRYLSQMAKIGKAQAPFVLEANASVNGSGPSRKKGRILYANGFDYQSRWGFGFYNSRNGSLGSVYLTLSDGNAERRRTLQAKARALAFQSQDPLAFATIHFAGYEQTEGYFDDSLRALQILIESAEAAPQETAFVAALDRALNLTVTQHNLCAEPGGEAFFPLVKRAVTLLWDEQSDAAQKSGLLSNILACGPKDLRDDIFQQKLALVSTTSDKEILSVLWQWAKDAHERGKVDIARRQMRVLADYHFAQTPVRESVNEGIAVGLISNREIELMYELGMQVEARKFGAQLIERFETTSPSQVVETSRASMGNFDAAIAGSARMYIRTRQFDHLYRLGVYERARSNPNGPNAADWLPPDTGPWFLAVTAIGKEMHASGLVEQYELAQIILPELLSAGALNAALQVSLIQAKAAERLGRFDDAEAAIVRTVAIAQSAGLSETIKAELRQVRQALNLSRLDDLAPAKRLIEQMNIYYADACGKDKDPNQTRPGFPDIDYYALAFDPSVAEALIRSDAMNQLLGCDFPNRLYGAETRFVCAVAALSGRQDVAQYLMVDFRADSRRENTISEDCLFGAVYGGRADWVPPQPIDLSNTYSSNIAGFMSLDAAARAQLIASGSMEDVDRLGVNDEVSIHLLEMDLPPLLDDGIALQKLGFYHAAEAYFANDFRIDPFNFGTETPATLNADLIKPDHITLRLRYARLYRDQGVPARAYGAIGPLTEQAIARLGSSNNPLPGTVEQWAKRFEPLFTAYLELQFDALPQGPNYPAIFAIQQYLQLANSTASASVLEQRLNSASPDVAREYQDARRALRRAIDRADEGDTKVAELSLQLQAVEARLPKNDAARQSHQIGVTKPLRDVVLELRKAEAAMVVATQLPHALVVMYLDGQGASARKLDLGQDASAAQVAAFRRGVLGSNDNRDLFDPQQAASLYQTLIGWGHVGKPAPNALRLVMDGPFSTLPFAALRRPDGWLGAQASLRLSPSVARAASGLRQGEDFRGFVGLGDPNLTKGNLTARIELLGAGFYLPELPETANELTFMALSFGGNPTTDVFTREAASEAQMRVLNTDNRLADVSILALATHGLLSRETGSLNTAGLVLSLPQSAETDGILTATEIYTYRIGADLVVLSACNTGTPGAGEGLSDLASAFLYSGAGALLLTHWEIDSGAGVEIMKRIALDQRGAGAADYAGSLQAALAGMLADEGLEKYYHPRFWASHFILG